MLAFMSRVQLTDRRDRSYDVTRVAGEVHEETALSKPKLGDKKNNTRWTSALPYFNNHESCANLYAIAISLTLRWRLEHTTGDGRVAVNI